jgi:hypothetical protein
LTNNENKKMRTPLAGDLITMANQHVDFWNNMITGYEMSCFCITHSLKASRVSGNQIKIKKKLKQKFCMDKSKGKVTLEVFFAAQGLVRCASTREGCTVNKEM